MLEELIKKREDNSLYVDSVDLNQYLNEGNDKESRHRDWIRSILKKYPFEENYDYVVTTKKVNTNNKKNPTTEWKNYEFTINMAKEVCMIDKRPKGKEVRRYFIEVEELYKKKTETNLKLNSMLLTHKEKLNLTKELFYPILDRLGVLPSKKNSVHQKIIKAVFGKYENLNKLTKLTDKDIDNYKKIAINMQTDTRYFINYDQITMWDIIKEI